MQRWYSLFLPRSARSAAWLAILIVLAISFLDLLGWTLDIPLLKSIRSQWNPMKIITAICMVLSATGLALLNRGPSDVRRRMASLSSGTLVALVGLLTIAVYSIELTTGREAALATAPFVHLFWSQAGRMALLTAILFLDIGCVLVLLAAGSRRAADIAHALILPAATASYLIPASYLLGVENIHDWLHVPVALNTGIAFCALCVAIFCIRPDTWLISVFAGDHAGGVMARRLLPGLLALPLVIGWFRLHGERVGAFESAVGVVLVALTYTVCLQGLVWLTARSVNRTDEQRRAAEEESRSLAQFPRENPNPVLRANGEGAVLYANHPSLTMLEAMGWREGRPLPELLLAPLRRAMSEGQYLETDLACPRERIWSFTLAPNTGQGYVNIYARDITERKRMETALEEAAKKYSTILATMQTGYWLSDRGGNFLEVNEAYCRMSGYSREELLRMRVRDVEANESPEEVQSHIRLVLERGHDQFESRHQRKDGTIFDADIRTTYLNIEGGRLVVFIWDITDRKRAAEQLRRAKDELEIRVRERTAELEDANRALHEEIAERKKAEAAIKEANETLERRVAERTAALRESEEDLNRAQAVAQTGSWRLDVRRNELIWSEENHRIFGIPKGIPLTYETFLGTVHPDDREYVDRQWKAALRGEPYDIEHRIGGGDSVKWVREKAELEVDKEGVLLGGFGTTQDITERKQAEETLRQTADDLARSNRDLEQFAYVASHDLQEPLRAVSGYLQLLERRYKDRLDKDANEFIQFAVNGAGRMQQLITDLLAYSRVGTRGHKLETTDCNEVLRAVLANLEIAIAESGAAVTHDPLPTVRGDRGQLVQLFQNLIGNAIKFRGPEPPRVVVTVKAQHGEWQFVVGDNGIGIEPQFFDRIFEVFQRLHGREEYSGTGIGLSICKRIVEQHGGRIWVESKPGPGSTFHFTIPKEM